MSRLPRILPLVAVAAGGVIAVKALEAAPALLSPTTAHAEGAPAAAKAAKAAAKSPLFSGASTSAGAAAGTSPLPGQAPKPPGVCAPTAAELAREAGLSPAELQIIQSLGQRRGQLDEREKALDTQIQVLAAAETKVDAKLKALSSLRDEIKGLLGQADQQTQAEVDRLVVVFEKMKPREAAPVMAQLDDKVRVPVASKMKPAILAQVLGQMQAADAKKLTELLAHRFAPVQALAQAANTAANTAADPNAPPPASPAPQVEAGKTPAPARTAARAAPKKAAPPRRRPLEPAPTPNPQGAPSGR